MSNSQFHPFERMNYFSGQLLTARNFLHEQEYLNGKRNFINRMIYGCGVICGLKVELDACGGLWIEPGVALDGHGREIVMNEKLKVEINDIEGCPCECKNEDHIYYLCLQYDECKKEPSPHSDPCSCHDSYEYNRILECFKIVLKEECPSPHNHCCTQSNEKQTVSQQCTAKEEPKRRNLLEECYGDKLFQCPCNCECECVVIAAICVNQGTVKSVKNTVRQHVYTNSLLYDLIVCMEEKIWTMERQLHQLLKERQNFGGDDILTELQ